MNPSLQRIGVTVAAWGMGVALLALQGGPAVAGVSGDADPLPPSAPGRLAYSTGHYEVGGIAVDALGTIGLDGSDQRVLTDPPGDGPAYGYDHSPQWSPDGTWLAYLQARPGEFGGYHDNVAVIPRDGGDPHVVDTDGYGPAWSPDGRRLAWVSFGEGGAEGSSRRIGVADVITTPTSITITNKRTMAISEGADMVGWPRFSPDGETLLLPAGRHASGNFESLYTMSMTDGRMRKVSGGRYLDSVTHASAFSPDGSRILYVGQVERADGGWPEVVVVNSDGTGERVLTRPGMGGAATWTPGGDGVVIAHGFFDGIAVVDLDGQLIDSVAVRKFNSFDSLVMSPDGSRVFSVAVPANKEGAPTSPADLYAIPLDGSAPQRLTFDHRVFPNTVQAIDPGAVIREYGGGPAATAVASVTAHVKQVDTLLVAPADDYAASLAAAPLAAKLGAAELVTSRATLSPEVLTAARRLGATRVVAVGALAPAVAARLRSSGLHVREVARTRSPYRLGAVVASELASRRAYLVPMRAGEAGQWKLPLATAGIAAHQRRPLLFTRPTGLSNATEKAIRRLGITSVTVVGDRSSIGVGVSDRLKKLGIKVHRVATSDPFELSAEFARRSLKSGAEAQRPVVASGTNWVASTTAPALAALSGQVTLLVDGKTLARSKATRNWLRAQRRATRTITLVGGVGAVRPMVEAQLEGVV